MRVAHFSLLALFSLLVASAPAGPQATGGSGLANLEEPSSNFDLAARVIETPALHSKEILERRQRSRGRPKKKASSSHTKSKGRGKSSSKGKKGKKGTKGKKDTASHSPGKTNELIKAAAAKRGVRFIPRNEYLFREDVGSESYLVLVKAPQTSKSNPNANFEIIKATPLKIYNDNLMNVGTYKCEGWHSEEDCAKVKFSGYGCKEATSRHKISPHSKLFFFNEKDTMYKVDQFAYKSAKETVTYDKCVKTFGHARNTAQMNAKMEMYYPGTWADSYKG